MTRAAELGLPAGEIATQPVQTLQPDAALLVAERELNMLNDIANNGRIDFTTSLWTDEGLAFCNNLIHLYCFQK